VKTINESFATVLDSLKGVIESFGEGSKKAGEGFSTLADAIIKLVNETGFFDLAATLGSVAAAVGDIAKTGKEAGDAYKNLEKLTETLSKLAETNFGTMAENLQTVADKLYVITLYTPTLKDTKKNLDELGNTKLTTLINDLEKLKTNIENVNKTGNDSFTKLSQTIADKLKSASKEVTAKFLEIESTISNKLTSINAAVSNTFSAFVSTISDKLRSASTEVTSKFREIETAITSQMNSISAALASGVSDWKITVENAIRSVKNLFGNGFSWNVPELIIPVKTPKFEVDGTWKFDSEGNVTKVPKIKVEWYRRAAEMGALFTQPAIIGVGDAAQPEMLIGEDTLYNSIRRAVAETSGGLNQTINITAPQGLNASETARLVRNNSRQMLARMRGGV
jgi:cell fate (sporulation/competence/biofilm development) regulator YlbF (YheA/YmcA/DUF963 family)